MSQGPVRTSTARSAEAEMMAKCVQQENDILRFQLNDLINREKNQRLELQRLRAHREVEVSALVEASTQQLKGEIERVKGLLEPAASSIALAVAEKDRVVEEKEELMGEMTKMRKIIEDDSTTYSGRLRNLESLVQRSSAMANNILASVEAFQRHVLPNFKVVITTVINKCHASDCDGPNKLFDDMRRLEAGIAMLRVIVDAKNDALVLIRGKLKQDNDDLRLELKQAKEEKPSPLQDGRAVAEQAVSGDAGEVGVEKNIIRQEVHALQELYAAKFRQLQAKLKEQEEANIVHQNRYCDIRNECNSLQTQLSTVEASRRQLEENFKDEASARSQLATEIFHTRKENEALRSELDMVKVNQKFFGGQARKGRLPMDLINTVNQLLFENSKLKSDKSQLEEEVKTHRRSNVLERVQSHVTARDVTLCATTKVGDSELASKLARIRLQRLEGTVTPQQFAVANGNSGLNVSSCEQSGDTPGIAGWSSTCGDATATINHKMAEVFECGHAGLAQLAGLTEYGMMTE